MYRIIANTIYSLDCVSTNFLKLVLLAGCKFDIYFKQLEKETQWPPVYAERVQPLHDSIKDLFSQPLTLQELSVMAIRQCIGSRQLWAKIDSLPVTPLVKDRIKLKTYSESGHANIYIQYGVLRTSPFCINVCKSMM